MLVVKDLTKTYENGVEALRGVSFQTGDCGMIAIVGSSGSGKSTLLNVLSGIDDKTDGEIFFDGVQCDPKQVKSTFATIYQDYKLIENLKVVDNILVAKELACSDYSLEQIDELLDKLGILECKNEKVLSLSGGQKQRVAIARALVAQPKIIFADEPTGNLDSKNTKNIFGLLQELAKDVLIIVVTHDVDTIKNYANRIIKFQDGLVIEDEIIAPPIVCQNSEKEVKEENKNTKTAKKAGLSFRTAMSVAVAFNKAKAARRIAFMAVTTALLILLMFCCNWAMIDYESMVRATYDKRNVSNMAIADYPMYDKVNTESGGSFLATTSCDLTEFAKYLKDKKGINSAKVSTSPVEMFDIRANFTGVHQRDIYDNYITLQEFAYGYNRIVKYIVSDDMQSLGIKLIEGRQPKKIGEIAIPKSKLLYFNALGGYYDIGIEEIIEVKDIFKHDFFGIKIVGVFDDGVVVPDKYAKSVYTCDSEEQQEAISYVTDKILAQSVVIPTAWNDVWEAAMYMKGPAMANGVQGQYVHTSWYTEDGDVNNVGVAPANNLTAHITGIDSVPKGQVLMNSRSKFKDGDTIMISTKLVRGQVGDLMGGAYCIDKEIQRNKKFVVKIDSRLDNQHGLSILYNDDDYKMMMGGYEKPQINNLIFNMDSLSSGELKQLSAKAKQLYGGKSFDGWYSSLNYNVDDGIGIMSEYYEMRMIGDYVMIAASIILAVLVGVLIYNSISIIITSKANDLLILKSLGATKLDYFKIYGIFTIVQLLIELVVAVLLGIGLVFLFDFLLTQVIDETLIVRLPLMGIAVVSSMLIALVTSVLTLTFNICSISDKNLRKAFQKTKE